MSGVCAADKGWILSDWVYVSVYPPPLRARLVFKITGPPKRGPFCFWTYPGEFLRDQLLVLDEHA